MTGEALLAEYATYHRDPRNLICHEIGIPLIVLSIFALLELVRAGPIDLAAIVGVLTLVYYGSINARIALIAAAAFIVMYYAGSFIAWPYAVALFVIGWIFQFVGHKFEGKSPAFLKNLMHLLIGPLWIVVKLTESKRSVSP